MCKYCENKILRSCRVIIEDKLHIRYSERDLGTEVHATGIYLPMNFCPACGRNLKEDDRIWNIRDMN